MNIEMQRFVHQSNIVRYKRILATYLTAEERRFVERRLGEEQVAIQQLATGIELFANRTRAA